MKVNPLPVTGPIQELLLALPVSVQVPPLPHIWTYPADAVATKTERTRRLNCILKVDLVSWVVRT